MPSKEFIIPQDQNWEDKYEKDGSYPWLRQDGENTYINLDIYKTYLQAAGQETKQAQLKQKRKAAAKKVWDQMSDNDKRQRLSNLQRGRIRENLQANPQIYQSQIEEQPIEESAEEQPEQAPKQHLQINQPQPQQRQPQRQQPRPFRPKLYNV